MEQIYTIPVNEAFDACRDKPECGCPMCRLYLSLVDTELDLILGASMMEPDVRIKTNEQGFCPTHYRRMQKRRRMLGMGLMMESHLAEVKKILKGPATLGNRRTASLKELVRLEEELFGEAASDYVRAAEIDERRSEIEEELLSLYEIVM